MPERKPRRKSKTEKDQSNELREHYRLFIEMKDTGIEADLDRYFGIQHATLNQLLSIIRIAKGYFGLTPPREAKRLRDIAIGWLNSVYAQVGQLMPRLTMQIENGEIRGPCAGLVQELMMSHPGHPLFEVIRRDD
jgi:hypothetical protein